VPQCYCIWDDDGWMSKNIGQCSWGTSLCGRLRQEDRDKAQSRHLHATTSPFPPYPRLPSRSRKTDSPQHTKKHMLLIISKRWCMHAMVLYNTRLVQKCSPSIAFIIKCNASRSYVDQTKLQMKRHEPLRLGLVPFPRTLGYQVEVANNKGCV
jgi:hypothetical protein